MVTFWQSFVEAIAPGHDCRSPKLGGPQNPTSGEDPPPQESWSKPVLGSGQSALEHRRVTDDPDVTQLEGDHEVLVEELGLDSEEDMWDLRNPRDSGDLASQIAVRRPVPASLPPSTSQTGPVQPDTLQSIETEESGFDADNLLLDAKFYQDTAIELQNSYDTYNIGMLNRHI